jgi:hypothetical protein
MACSVANSTFPFNLLVSISHFIIHKVLVIINHRAGTSVVSHPLCNPVFRLSTVPHFTEAGDGVTSDLKHDCLQSSCYGVCCLNVLFTAVSNSYSFTVGMLCVWHRREVLIMLRLKIQVKTFPTKCMGRWSIAPVKLKHK